MIKDLKKRQDFQKVQEVISKIVRLFNLELRSHFFDAGSIERHVNDYMHECIEIISAYDLQYSVNSLLGEEKIILENGFEIEFEYYANSGHQPYSPNFTANIFSKRKCRIFCLNMKKDRKNFGSITDMGQYIPFKESVTGVIKKGDVVLGDRIAIEPVLWTKKYILWEALKGNHFVFLKETI